VVTDATTVIVYHDGCPDGICAAYVAGEALIGKSPVTYIPAKHGDLPAPAILDRFTGRAVVFVDFVWPRAVMLDIVKQARSVMVLDHHQTAHTEIGDLLTSGVIAGEIDLTGPVSGVGVTWRYYHQSGNTLPALFCHVQDRDTWTFTYVATPDVLAAFMADEMTLAHVGRMLARPIDEIASEGAILNRARERRIADALTRAHEVTIAGHTIPAVNCPYDIGSDVANRLAEQSPIDGSRFAAYYFRDGNLWQWGLRSVERADGVAFDVAKLAETFGGGGHPRASGFRVQATRLTISAHWYFRAVAPESETADE
jgi:uncharacterized protein